MIDAAEKKHISLLVGHVLRWDARYAMVKERISSGSVGKIAAISARRTCSRLGAARYLPYITPIMQTAVHDIDLILWFTGSYVVECFSRPARALEYENPDTTLSILSLANGTEVSLLNSFSLPEKIPFWSGARMEIYGSKMFVVVDATEQLLFLCDEVGWSNPDTTLAPILGGSIAGSLKDELSYFVRCVSKGEKPGVILPSEARNALEVAISCEKSLASGEPVRLNSSKR
jgi:predicted dehydrogenase